MGHQGLQFKTFKAFALFFNIMSTLFWFPDLVGFYQRHQAIQTKQRPPASSTIVTIVVLVVEDIPQFLLNVYYMAVVNNEAYGNPKIDPVAIFSLLMSLTGLITNSLIVLKPGWFFDVIDKETGAALPEMDDKFGTFVRKVRQRASMRMGRGGESASSSSLPSKTNPMFVHMNQAAIGYDIDNADYDNIQEQQAAHFNGDTGYVTVVGADSESDDETDNTEGDGYLAVQGAVAEERAVVAPELEPAAQEPNVCIQTGSKGPCTQLAMTGSQRCANHTCSQEGCTKGKSTAAKLCSKHAKAATGQIKKEVFEGFAGNEDC